MTATIQSKVANGKAHSEAHYVNHGEEEEMEVQGYEKSRFFTALVWVAMVLTLGIPRLVFHWKPFWGLLATHRRCSLASAKTLLFKENYQGNFTTYYIKKVQFLSTSSAPVPEENHKDSVHIHLSNGAVKDVETIRAVRVKKLWYIWDEDIQGYVRLSGLDKGVNHAGLHQYKGYQEKEQRLRQALYGPNEIAVPLQSILTLLFLEILTPFYIFQVFTLIVWICELYLYYTGAIIIMSIFGVTSSIVQTRKNQRSLYATVHSTDTVQVSRGETVEIIPASSLVPGDVIIIPSKGCQLHCDAALLSGTCIVNESMLTGESVPVTKTPLPLTSTLLYDPKEDAVHTLFCGTKVIQTRTAGSENVKAVVLRTGYLTAKGSLVRSILYPPPADFRFEQDVNRFLGVLAVIAFLGVIYTVASKATRFLPAGDVALKALDIITIVVPPALPATMTMGKLYGQSRLQAAKIFCINSRVINVAGSLDCVCFDKTGTLTEDGLDMWGVVPVKEARFKKPLKAGSDLTIEENELTAGMATCHSIAEIDGQMVGDPLDVKMFMFTGWTLEEHDESNDNKGNSLAPTVVHSQTMEVGIVHQYQFSSTLQRMSVVTRRKDSEQFVAYCKGSPEKIAALSKPDTVPVDLALVLSRYTSKGYRVIALGWRTLEESSLGTVKQLPRDSVEQDLSFVGLIVLENRLKPESTPIIHQLKEAQIRTIMVTGDNIETAISVARECGIVEPGQSIMDVTAVPGVGSMSPKITFSPCSPPLITSNFSIDGGILNGAFQSDEGKDVECGKRNATAPYMFALTGNSWAVVRESAPELLPRVLTRGAVFARMSSDQKQQLVTALKDLGYCVAMCGDGANDCGALKAANVGISLSEAEASVASPFTSREANISCVPRVVREGRAALVTAVGIFKFMVAYSLSEFVSAAILYTIDSNLTDFQFLFIDIFLVVNFALLFGKTRAFGGPLVKETPVTSLFSLMPISSLVTQMFLVVLIQVLAFLWVQTFSWFEPFQYNGLNYKCYENYAVYSISMFQYISLVVVFSQGAPYRECLLKNKVLMTSLIIMTAICIYITLSPAEWVQNFLELRVPPYINFPIILLCLGLVHFMVALFLEKILVQYIVFKKLRYMFHSIDKSRKKYLRVEQELLMAQGWPPLSGDPLKDQFSVITRF